MIEIANLLTACRILLSILILFYPAFSPMFYALYLSAGLTDMFDGVIARKTNTVSEFGSKLDTVADFILFVVCMVKLLPVIRIPVWLWIWIGIITVIKIVNIISGYAVQKKLVVKAYGSKQNNRINVVCPAVDFGLYRNRILRWCYMCSGNFCGNTGGTFNQNRR